MPITIIGTWTLLPKKSMKLHKGNIILVIDVPIDTTDLNIEDKNMLLTQCRNVIIQNKKIYSSEQIHSYELFST